MREVKPQSHQKENTVWEIFDKKEVRGSDEECKSISWKLVFKSTATVF
jgi:hypothetical protein